MQQYHHPVLTDDMQAARNQAQLLQQTCQLADPGVSVQVMQPSFLEQKQGSNHSKANHSTNVPVPPATSVFPLARNSCLRPRARMHSDTVLSFQGERSQLQRTGMGLEASVSAFQAGCCVVLCCVPCRQSSVAVFPAANAGAVLP